MRVPRSYRSAPVSRSSTDLDNLRTGTFVSLYKFLINSLPLLVPAINPRSSRPHYDASPFDGDVEADDAAPSTDTPMTTVVVPIAQRRARLSLSAHAQLILVRKKTRRWHAAMAGGVAGGLAIMFESSSRRAIIAQQMFVRCVDAVTYCCRCHLHSVF